MNTRPVEILLFHMPTVADRADDPWARDFAWSVLRQSKRPRWRPSKKQEAIMQSLVADLFHETEVLIEE